MDLQIALMLVQDGIVNGAIYALMALALVLVFSVTRVIFIPQGEFVAYAALAMAALQTGKLPPLLWMLLGMAALCLVVEAVRQARGLEVDWKSTLFWAVGIPAGVSPAGARHGADPADRVCGAAPGHGRVGPLFLRRRRLAHRGVF